MPGSCKCGKLAQPDGRSAYTVHLLWLSMGQGMALIRLRPLLPLATWLWQNAASESPNATDIRGMASSSTLIINVLQQLPQAVQSICGATALFNPITSSSTASGDMPFKKATNDTWASALVSAAAAMPGKSMA